MGQKAKTGKKEEIAEDCCFVCKDGGDLRICDEKGCLKAYHPQCVDRDDSFLEDESRWVCGWHYCSLCSKASKFQCFCCPYAVCGSQSCMDVAKFVLVKEKKGFCIMCITVAKLLESEEDADSDGDKVDFDDVNTYEYMFRAYWPNVKEDKNLTAHEVSRAAEMMRCKNQDLGSKSKESDEEKYTDESQDESSEESEEWESRSKRKRSHKKIASAEKKMKSKKKKKFNGWGSELLIEFLSSIGKDTTKQLSEFEVSSIITEYCREKNLFHPQKKKQVICNAELEQVLGRKFFNKNSLTNLLSKHFAENLEQSDDDNEWSSEHRDESVQVAHHTSTKSKEKSTRKCHREEEKTKEKSATKSDREKEDVSLRLNSFAAIVPQNLKHVYLRGSLVLLILKQSKDFEKKLTGSYVRIRSAPNDYLQKNSHMLVQVSGLVRQDEILLKVSNMVANVPISKLSDEDFSEKECEDLLRRMKTGWPKLPTVMELQEKATSLHQDITKQWIEKEIVVLQMRMNQANEKGWRRELSDYMERIKLLRTESEQSRLLSELPEIIAHKEDLEPTRKDYPREVEIPKSDSKRKILSTIQNAGVDAAGVIKTPDFREQRYNFGKSPASKVQGSWPAQKNDDHTSKALENHSTGNNSKEQCLDAEPEKQTKKTATDVNIIDLSSDDDEDALPSQQVIGDVNSSEWYCVMPKTGLTIGPYCMALLKDWKDAKSLLHVVTDVKFKVYRIGQNPGDAINLDDAMRMYVPKK